MDEEDVKRAPTGHRVATTDMDPEEIYEMERLKLERRLAKMQAQEDFDLERLLQDFEGN